MTVGWSQAPARRTASRPPKPRAPMTEREIIKVVVRRLVHVETRLRQVEEALRDLIRESERERAQS